MPSQAALSLRSRLLTDSSFSIDIQGLFFRNSSHWPRHPFKICGELLAIALLQLIAGHTSLMVAKSNKNSRNNSSFSLGSQTGGVTSQDTKGTNALEFGKPIECELTGGQSHLYTVVITANQYVHVIVDQRGIDVVVTLFAPDGRKLTEVDSPNGTQGPEPVSWIAETPGDYRLEIRSLENAAAAGRYQLKIAELRAATEQDKKRILAEQALLRAQGETDAKRVTAQQMMRDGEELFLKGTKESLAAAAEKNLQAASIFRSIGYGAGEAAALDNLGQINYELGNKKEALDYCLNALDVARASKDQYAEGMALVFLGQHHSRESDNQRAMDYFKQAIPLLIATEHDATPGLEQAFMLYRLAGEERKALEFFANVLTQSRTASDEANQGRVLNIIGMLHWYLNDRPQALDYYLQALPLLRKSNDRRALGMTLNNIGLACFLPEGLVGLTRGFMYAGAPRVVVSLWSVDDEATAELMVDFFKGVLKHRLPPATALRQAQIRALKSRRWKSPHFWAAFELQCEWR